MFIHACVRRPVPARWQFADRATARLYFLERSVFSESGISGHTAVSPRGPKSIPGSDNSSRQNKKYFEVDYVSTAGFLKLELIFMRTLHRLNAIGSVSAAIILG